MRSFCFPYGCRLAGDRTDFRRSGIRSPEQTSANGSFARGVEIRPNKKRSGAACARSRPFSLRTHAAVRAAAGRDQPPLPSRVGTVAQRLALIEQLLPYDARLQPDIENPILQPQIGREIRHGVAHHLAPRIGQPPFGDLRRHIGTREKLFEQVAHQHRFGPSHRLLSVRSQQSFSRHGIARASAALPIWLNENVEFLSSISRLGNSSKFDCTRLNEMVCLLAAVFRPDISPNNFGSALEVPQIHAVHLPCGILHMTGAWRRTVAGLISQSPRSPPRRGDSCRPAAREWSPTVPCCSR